MIQYCGCVLWLLALLNYIKYLPGEHGLLGLAKH